MGSRRFVLCVGVLLLVLPGCSLFKPKFVDRGQVAPAFASGLEDEKLRAILAERLGAVHTLKCNGVDMTVDAAEGKFSADLLLFIDPPSYARAIASKGIIGTVADILAVGNRVTVYVPPEKKVYQIRMRAADFRSLRTMPWAAIWGLRREGQSPAVGESVEVKKNETEVIVDVPFPLGYGNTERLIFDRETLLLRSRTIRREGEPAAAIIEYMRWHKVGDVWWPLLTRFRAPRLDTEITLEFRVSKTKLNQAVSPEVFKQAIPDGVEVVQESLR